MPYTKLETCSQALGRLNDELFITAEQLEGSENKQARGCNLYFDKSRRQVLRDHDWDFATRRATLTASTATPDFGWAYQYPLPSDNIRVRTYNQLDPGNELEHFWDVENSGVDDNEGGSVLVSDETTCNIVYTYDSAIENFDDLAHEGVVLVMASKLAFYILGDKTLSAVLLQEYAAFILPQAKGVDSMVGNSKRESRFKHSRWWKARFNRGI